MADREDYFLHSERLGFRHWSADDLDLALALWGDAAVTRLIGGPFDRAAVQARLEAEIAMQKVHGIQYWPFFLRASGVHAGCCGLRPYEPDSTVYEIGFHLRPSCWGQGYASEAARAVIAYAFDIRGAAALFAGHHPANEASRHLLLKLGFVYTHDELYAPTGLDHPSYWLARPADD